MTLNSKTIIFVVLCIFTIVLQNAEAKQGDITKQDCKLNTSAKKNKNVYFIFEFDGRVDNFKELSLTIGDKKLTLFTKTTKIYVKYAVPNVDELPCEISDERIKLSYDLVEVENPAIGIARGESIAIAFGTTLVKVVHDTRDFVPLKIMAYSEKDLSAEISPPGFNSFAKAPRMDLNKEAYSKKDILGEVTLTDSNNNEKKTRIYLKKRAENLFMIPKEQLHNADTFDLTLTMPSDVHVIITNLQEDKPTISMQPVGSYLTCFSKKCLMKFDNNDGVQLSFKLINLGTLEDKPQIEIRSNPPEVIKNILPSNNYVFHEQKDAIPDELFCEFSSGLTNILIPPTFLIYNSLMKGPLEIESSNYFLIGKSSEGILSINKEISEIELTMRLGMNKAQSAQVDFNIINADASKPEDLIKSVKVDENAKSIILFEDQLNYSHFIGFSLKIEGDKRGTVHFEIKNKFFINMLPGSWGILSGFATGIIRKLSLKNTTLIFEIATDSRQPQTNIKMGDEEFTVGKEKVYKYITPKDFKGKEEMLCKTLQPEAVVSYKRFKSIVSKRPCSLDPCENEGTCEDVEGKYVCKNGFIGENCQIKSASAKVALSVFSVLLPTLLSFKFCLN